MNIPNDTGHPYRLNKYVEYQHKVPPIGPHTYLAWAKLNKLTAENCIMLAWYFSMSYCELTAIYLLRNLDVGLIKKQDIEVFWEQNKQSLIFSSSRMYVKNMDWFVPLMNQFMKDVKRNPYAWLKQLANYPSYNNTPQEKYKNVYKYLMKWKFMGRFSVELFTDALVQMSREGLLGDDLTFKAPDFDWKHGSNITACMFNILYQDELADNFDKGEFDPKWIPELDRGLKEIQKAIKKEYPEQDTGISVITPKMCSFRNLFKGSRYGGYHHDRQLEQLFHYKKVYPEDPLWDKLFKLRKRIFVPELLGEIGGWSGIRKERKKLWLREGLTGVEIIGEHKRV